MAYDLVIKNGLVIDDIGAPACRLPQATTPILSRILAGHRGKFLTGMRPCTNSDGHVVSPPGELLLCA
jgi:hypothetical protein